MNGPRRPLADRIEVAAPGLAAVTVRLLGRAPEPIRRRALAQAFERAAHAFNRGDLEAVFAPFADEVEYVPPPPLHAGPPLQGRAAVLDFWRGILARYDHNKIENLSLEETGPSRFVRHARLEHRSVTRHEELEYTIVQTTELVCGRVNRQVNALG